MIALICIACATRALADCDTDDEVRQKISDSKQSGVIDQGQETILIGALNDHRARADICGWIKDYELISKYAAEHDGDVDTLNDADVTVLKADCQSLTDAQLIGDKLECYKLVAVRRRADEITSSQFGDFRSKLRVATTRDEVATIKTAIQNASKSKSSPSFEKLTGKRVIFIPKADAAEQTL